MEHDRNLKRKYEISDYDPSWVTWFEEIKSELVKIFSDAVSIEHIGSTSIEGMKAKPLMDVLISVKEMKDFDKEINLMKEIGYAGRRDYIRPNTINFFKEKEGSNQKIVNIHVCEKDSYKDKQFLLMRDYMRAHPEIVKEYSELKIELNKKFPGDYPAYRAGKDDYLKDMEQKAYKWKEL